MLLRAAGFQPHVLVAAMPGATQVRLAAEQQLRRRGWPCALTPADTDVLLVAGTPAGDMASAVQAAWAAVPAPRVRAEAARPDQVAGALDAARAELASASRQRHEAARGGGPVPGGLPMADRGADSDGLKLDQLHLRLGPVLPDWPAGLVVQVTLQGDVVQEAEAQHLGVATAGGSFWDEPWRRAAAGEAVTAGTAARRSTAAALDSLGRFLAVAGWDSAATTARRLRDEILAGTSASEPRRFAARVARSRPLAWSTRGMGVIADAPERTSDVTARYRRWCDDIAELAGRLDDASPLRDSVLAPPRGRPATGRPPSAALLELLPGLLRGAEFATARLIIASLDPDPDPDELGIPAGRHGG